MNNTTTMAASTTGSPSWSGVTSINTTGTVSVQGQLFPYPPTTASPPSQQMGTAIIGQGPYGITGGGHSHTIYSPSVAIGSQTKAVQTQLLYFKWNLGYDFPSHLFTGDTTLVPVLEIKRQAAMMFHISVWKKVCNPNEQDFGIVWGWQTGPTERVSGYIEFSKMTGVLMFKQGETLEQFKTWWAEYTKRFDGDDWQTQQLPQLKDGMEINCCPIAHKLASNYNQYEEFMANDVLFDHWCWIVERTTEPVLFTPSFWLFSNTAEMLMYKLIDEK